MFLADQKYTGIITPVSYVADLLIINLFAYLMPINFESPVLFHGYISLAWIIISWKNAFYEIYPYTKVTSILIKLFTQFVFFFLILYAYIGFFKQPVISRLALGQYLVFVFVAVFTLKFINYIIMMKYRERLKGHSRHVVVIGKNKKTEQLIKVFSDRTEYGYQFVKQFSPEDPDFNMRDCFIFIVQNNIDEIYCSVSELSNQDITDFINFADNNLKSLKFLPDNKNIYAKKLRFEYYDYIPILSLRDIPLHNPLNALLKRTFDIVFSLLVIFGLLIWLAPLLDLSSASALLLYLPMTPCGGSKVPSRKGLQNSTFERLARNTATSSNPNS